MIRPARRSQLEALAGDMARQLGCTPADARQALGELQRAGLVAVRRGRVVLPLAPIRPAVGGSNGL